MATTPEGGIPSGTILLELLHFAGWQLELRDHEPPTIRARRAGVELDVRGSSLADAVRQLFFEAMRGGRPRRRAR